MQTTPDCVSGTESDQRASMPRYFFHIRDRALLTEDPEGEELAAVGAARAEAIHVARDLMAIALRAGKPIGLIREVQIVDFKGETLATLKFAAARPPEEFP